MILTDILKKSSFYFRCAIVQKNDYIEPSDGIESKNRVNKIKKVN